MDLRKLKKLIDLVEESGIAELEITEGEEKVKIVKGGSGGKEGAVLSPSAPAASLPAAQAAPALAAAASASTQAEAPTSLEGHIVKSPMVGTFYRSGSPGAKPFVEVGDTVKAGQAICIIEAMKLMNEIDSEYEGEVVKAYVENGQAVQFDERLFAIRAK
jgi:acetyl-CoA carboxylase biotin carboxyl carrier protein